jgi:molybdopterin-guanine dinucleotide biosynthesis protein
MTRGGIFGISLSGKTTLAKKISTIYAVKYKIPSLVLDPHLEDWPTYCTVTDDEEKFWATVWETKKPCLVIVDEAAATIRRERDLIPVFTRLRHLNHKLLVIGHDGSDLLPVMRQQLDTVYLFRQDEDSCKWWVKKFADKRIEKAKDLQQYEYLYCRMFREPVKITPKQNVDPNQ